MSQTSEPMEIEGSSNSVQPFLEYTYAPLDLEDGAFRLLYVRPSDDPSSNIHCTLIPGKVGRKVDYAGELLDYHPLSYVWGDPNPPKTIYVEGKPIVIRPNLFAALKQLRLREEPILLWVDAICIDQNNIEERNQQVNLMEQIYKLNGAVYMWLGKEADGSDLAMETLSLIKNFIEEDNEEEKRAKLREIMKASFDGSFDQNWMAVTHLFRRQYWTRVWILQEVLQSSQALLHCGTKRLPWTPIHSFLVAWPNFRMGLAAQKAMYYSGWARELAKFHIQVVSKKISLLDGLLLSRQRFATLSVDHVYGILSMVDLKGRPLPPNYNNGTMTVFRDVVLHAIQTECNLDILTACKGHNLGSSLRPSSHRKAVQLAHLKVLHMLQQLERVPHMANAILNSLEGHVQLEDLSTADKSGLKESPESNLNGDDSSMAGLDPPGDKENSQKTQADALQELQNQLQVPHLRIAMQDMLRKAKLPDLLRLFKDANSIDLIERQLLPWPSWIPDWTIPHPKTFQPGILYLLLSGPKPAFYQAAGTTEPLCTFSEDDFRLVARGGLVDRVDHVSPHYRENENPSDKEIYKIAELDWQLYCTLVDSTNPYGGDEEARLKAFRGTQILGRDVSGKEEDFSDGTFHDMFWKYIGVTALREDPEAVPLGDPRFNYGTSESANNFGGRARVDQATSYMRYDCRFFITQQGYIGRGPPSLQQGDQVCVLFGGRVPFILRKDKEVEEFQLVGEAYVHGIMKGEAMQDLSARDFVLR
ncbi:heterokaryon incompatibility protein-domain-containing protein [Bisporella sp. PMI_857]|nr:heterokaryon incompatibility protein-domain-containing protein [Bisporella sp. PMI_857]